MEGTLLALLLAALLVVVVVALAPVLDTLLDRLNWGAVNPLAPVALGVEEEVLALSQGLRGVAISLVPL